MKKGFTLIELMIVVAIIAIIAAIAIPNLLRARISANEANGAGAMRIISTGEVGYQTASFADADGDGVGDYGTLAALANPDGAGATPPFIDAVLGAGAKHGYLFVATPTPGAPGQNPVYNCTGVPQAPGQTGYKTYYVDESGVTRTMGDGTAAGPASPPL